MVKNPDETSAIIRVILSELLVIDEARISVDVRADGAGHTRLTIHVDGAEPRGRHRELISDWARGAGGQIMGDA